MLILFYSSCVYLMQIYNFFFKSFHLLIFLNNVIFLIWDMTIKRDNLLKSANKKGGLVLIQKLYYNYGIFDMRFTFFKQSWVYFVYVLRKFHLKTRKKLRFLKSKKKFSLLKIFSSRLVFLICFFIRAFRKTLNQITIYACSFLIYEKHVFKYFENYS